MTPVFISTDKKNSGLLDQFRLIIIIIIIVIVVVIMIVIIII